MWKQEDYIFPLHPKWSRGTTFWCSDQDNVQQSLKNIFDFTIAGDWDCVAAVERLPALHCSVEFIFLSFGIISFIVEVWNYWRVTDAA